MQECEQEAALAYPESSPETERECWGGKGERVSKRGGHAVKCPHGFT